MKTSEEAATPTHTPYLPFYSIPFLNLYFFPFFFFFYLSGWPIHPLPPSQSLNPFLFFPTLFSSFFLLLIGGDYYAFDRRDTAEVDNDTRCQVEGGAVYHILLLLQRGGGGTRAVGPGECAHDCCIA